MSLNMDYLFTRSFVCKSFVSVQVSVVRPPNYTLLMIWIPVLVLALIVGYLKRENLHALYEPRYWAVAAMVYIYNLRKARG